MAWTRLDDNWTDKRELEDLDFADRWHYLCMIQFCNRNNRRDGVIRGADARRCSDHPHAVDALMHLASAGLIEPLNGAYRVIRMEEDHMPPVWVERKREQEKLRKRRQRAHAAGDHSLCIFGSCPQAPCPDDSPDDSHAECPDDSQVRSGQVRSGSYNGDSRRRDDSVKSWPVVDIPGKDAS